MHSAIQLAQHSDPNNYWQGGNFELNLSFDLLNSNQWKQVIAFLWTHDSILGPFAERFIPNVPPTPTNTISYPEPTATYTQHAALQINEVQLGLDILITRSLFECVTLMIPVDMLANLVQGDNKAQPYPLAQNPARQQLEVEFKELALSLYRIVPFSIASMGWNRECQLLTELTYEENLREKFLAVGNSLITDTALIKCKLKPTDYEQVYPSLRWIPPSS